MNDPLQSAEVTDYAALAATLDALLGDETDVVANAANAAAFLYHALSRVSWVGFYFARPAAAGEEAPVELVLGPFQGKPACVRIPWARGVCGTAAAARATQCVPDVHAFEGHIACDPDARSEVVVPLVAAGEVFGVLDVDSASPGRFTPADAAGLEQLAAVFVRRWPAQPFA